MSLAKEKRKKEAMEMEFNTMQTQNKDRPANITAIFYHFTLPPLGHCPSWFCEVNFTVGQGDFVSFVFCPFFSLLKRRQLVFEIRDFQVFTSTKKERKKKDILIEKKLDRKSN